MTVALPQRAAPRRNETRDIVRPILACLNRIAGVRVVRNLNVGAVVPYHARLDPNPPRFIAGLGDGSADIVGIVRMQYIYTAHDGFHSTAWVGRAIALEVKLPRDRAKALDKGAAHPDQVRWLAAFRRFGGFAAIVRSVEEAVEAVDRCRAGADQ